MDGSDTAGLKKRDLVLLAVLFLVALGIRLYFLQFYRVISADGVGYATAAREFIKGNGLGMSVIYGVVYPVLVGLTSLTVPDIELAGRLVSMVMGSLLVVPVYLLGGEFFNKKVALAASLFVMVWPSIRSWSGEVMTQSTYMTLLLMGVYLLWRGFAGRSRLSMGAGGLFMATAYLTRPEALMVFIAVTAVLLLSGRLSGVSKEPLIAVICSAGGFLLLFVPYLFFVHAVTGRWQVTGKTGIALADALSEYLGRPDMKREPGFQAIGMLDVLRSYPDFVVSNFVKNLKQTWETMLPVPLWCISLIGFIWSGWDRERICARLFLLATFVPLLIIITFFFVGPEYLQPYLPIMFLWTGQGAVRIEEQTLRWLRVERWPILGRLAAILPPALLVIAIYCLMTVAGQVPAGFDRPYHFADDGGRYDQKRLGLLLKEHLPGKSAIMTRWGRISFYADRGRVDMPQATLAEIITAARVGGARFIVVDGMLANVRPQLGVLLQPLLTGGANMYYLVNGRDDYRPLPGVRLYLLYTEPSSVGMAVYELL